MLTIVECGTIPENPFLMHLLAVAAEPSTNKSENPHLFRPGTQELINIRPEHFQAKHIEIARFTEDDYFELLENFESSKDRLEPTHNPNATEAEIERQTAVCAAIVEVISQSLAILAFKYDLADDEA